MPPDGTALVESRAMHILYVSHRLPYPPTHGGKIRAFNTIKHLARSNRVTVATLAESREEAEMGRELANHCDRVEIELVERPRRLLNMMARLPTTVPSTMGYFHSARLKRRIDVLAARDPIDLIVVHCSSVADYVIGMSGIPKVLDFVDMDSEKWLEYGRHKPFPLSVGYRLEGVKMRAAERRLAGLFDLCTVTTPAEKKTLDALDSGSRTAWFPNGVDTEYFSPSGNTYDPDMLCFVGRMNYYPNEECITEFCSKTFPLMRNQRPGLKLFIVGADPTFKVRRLSRIPGVTVTGSVPDVRPYLQRAAVMVAPLNIARGVQNKILEAMAMGVPVVSSRTAARGVDAIEGTHLLSADTPEQYSAAIAQILRSPSERERLSNAGKERVLTHHTWKHAMEVFDAAMWNVIQEKSWSRVSSSAAYPKN